MEIPEPIIAMAVQQFIMTGVARCAACELRITDPDEDIVACVCGDCGELTIWHEGCVPPEGRKEMLQQELRRNWRWN